MLTLTLVSINLCVQNRTGHKYKGWTKRIICRR